MNLFPKMGRTKGQRERSSSGPNEDLTTEGKEPGAPAVPPAMGETVMPPPVDPDLLTAAAMLADTPDAKPARFGWFAKLSVRHRVMLGLAVVLVVGFFFMPRKHKTSQSVNELPVTPTAQTQTTISQTAERTDSRGGDSQGDDLDPQYSRPTKYPTRVAINKPVNPEPEEKPGQRANYERSVARPQRGRDVTAGGTASSATTTDDNSEARNEMAGAPHGVTSLPASGKRAVLPEILGMEVKAQRSASSGAARASGAPANLASARQVSVEAEEFAPFGRLIKCKLVFTVDSISTGAPIIGLVAEDLWWNGKLIIPAGTELFSTVQSTKRDAGQMGRIMDSGEWHMVLPAQDGRTNGRELTIKGQALDRRELVVEDHGRVRAWGLEDGSPGLLGETIRTADHEEMMMLASAGMAGLSKGFSQVLQTQQTAPGLAGAMGATQAQPTVSNALLAGGGDAMQSVLDKYSARIEAEIANNGSYVRVKGGQEFYVFVAQALEPLNARVVARLNAARPNSQ